MRRSLRFRNCYYPARSGLGLEPVTQDVPTLLLRQNNLLRAVLYRLTRQVQRGYVYAVTVNVTDPTVPLEVTFSPPRSPCQW